MELVVNPFRNLILNLQATGPAAVLCVLIVSIALLEVFGSESLGPKALGLLAFLAGALVVGLVSKIL